MTDPRIEAVARAMCETAVADVYWGVKRAPSGWELYTQQSRRYIAAYDALRKMENQPKRVHAYDLRSEMMREEGERG